MRTELAGRAATWGSVLSADEFAAVRSVGFEPVGQVFGAAVYPLLCDGYRTAIDRMTRECSDLGGHGIVGASLQVTEKPGDNFTAATVEFTAIGTAVRGRGCPPLAR